MTAPRRRSHLNVLQRITLGYWALLVPMVIAGVLIILTVALIQTRYVKKENAWAKVQTAANDLRIELAQQQGRLEALAGGSGVVLPDQVAGAQHDMDTDALRLSGAVRAAGGVKAYPPFAQAWADYAGLEKQTIASSSPGATAAQAAAAAETAAAAAENVTKEYQATYDATDKAMWKFVYSTTGVALAIIVIGAVAGFVMAVMLPRGVARQLQSVVGSLRGTTSQMAAVASQVAATSVETATAVSEAATTVDEVRQTSLLASQKATAVADDSERARDIAAEGLRAAGDALEGMARIQREMGSVTESVARMSEHAQSVDEVMGTMNALADQSQLLSVNAALEAAGAGVHGKGFGVVADEIRNLASGSKKGVVRVRTLIGDVQHATSSSVMAVENGTRAIDEGARRQQESTQAIDELAQSVEASAVGAAQIVASSQQQLVGMDQIASAMGSIDQASSQNAAGATQLETGVAQVDEMAEVLQDMVAMTNPLAALRTQRRDGAGAAPTDEPTWNDAPEAASDR